MREVEIPARDLRPTCPCVATLDATSTTFISTPARLCLFSLSSTFILPLFSGFAVVGHAVRVPTRFKPPSTASRRSGDGQVARCTHRQPLASLSPSYGLRHEVIIHVLIPTKIGPQARGIVAANAAVYNCGSVLSTPPPSGVREVRVSPRSLRRTRKLWLKGGVNSPRIRPCG